MNDDIEQAANLGMAAIESTSSQASRRSLQVIREVGAHLEKHSKQPDVRNFRERARLLLAG